MHTSSIFRVSSIAAALVLGIGAAHAAVRTPAAEIQAQYEQERAVCLTGRSNQDRATCLQEAGAARNEARRGLLEESQSTNYQRNALERCRVFNGEDAKDCRARILGAGDTRGSVAAGGILRELVTIEPAPAPAPAPAPPQ
ncbi:MAG: hypothetical protein ABUL50_06960 [Rhizobacter sp.]